MSDENDQADEILALKSIYGDKIVSCNTEVKPLRGILLIDVDPHQSFEDGVFEVSVSDNPDALVFFKHLNPVTLSFTLPPDYPSKSHPTFSLNIYWLSKDQTKALSTHLQELCEEQGNSVVLFTWFNFLQNEALCFLNITSAIPLAQEKILKLVEHNAIKEERDFKRSIQLCPVCFTDKPGSQCKRLINCEHVFCNLCLQGYLEMVIKEGGVSAIRCMDADCSCEINPANVKSLVSDELFSRYDHLLLQSSLDCMTDVQYCPRKGCGCVVIVDKEHSLGSCTQCDFTFCTYCKSTYHGMEPCKFQAGDKEMYKKYMEAGEEEKEEMEAKYGKKKIDDMVSACQSLQWIENSTVKCPKCQRCIEKIDGCNKMTCTKCNAYFCWLCGHVLDKGNPYSHYGDKSGKCYNKLFLGLTRGGDGDEEEEDDDNEFVFLLDGDEGA